MGKRGFPSAPAAVKVRRGETRPSRVNYNEPDPDPSEPVMPPGMDDIARETWRFTLDAMRGTGVIKRVDQHLLRIYCEAYSRYVEASRAYAADVPVIRGARGSDRVRNPLHQIVRDHADQVRQFARELGIGPTSRASLEVQPGDLPTLADLGPAPRLRVVGGNE